MTGAVPAGAAAWPLQEPERRKQRPYKKTGTSRRAPTATSLLCVLCDSVVKMPWGRFEARQGAPYSPRARPAVAQASFPSFRVGQAAVAPKTYSTAKSGTPFFRYIRRMDISAGLTPGMRDAWPMVSGRWLFNFSRDSKVSCAIAS